MKFLKFLFIILYFILLSCSKSTAPKDSSTKKKPDDSNSVLSKYDLESKTPLILTLPKNLTEISGITMTNDGRLFAQHDESGIIYEVDINNGEIKKKFSLGNPPLKQDFEDIVSVNDKFYLLNSRGELYEFSEGNDGSSVDFKVYKTDLKERNDVEGLCYDAETNTLLLACKGDAGTGDALEKAIYSFSLDKMQFNDVPRFVLPLSEIKKTFNPSGIGKHPETGSFFVISANGNELVEITKDGKLLGRRELPTTVHVQPEGITFGKDNTMYISNEGKSDKGTIVIYPYK
ncbi:MAG: SdiA-regulated domain-containing protein [Ignavibacteria bacterium]